MLLIAACGAWNQQAAAQPNIIHVIADDLGWTDLSSGLTNFGNGSSFYQTPNIDRLATEGMAFTSAYALQTCVPTRVAIMTGQYATRTGVYNVVDIDGESNDPLVGAATSTIIDNGATTSEKPSDGWLYDGPLRKISHNTRPCGHNEPAWLRLQLWRHALGRTWILFCNSR